MATPSRTRSHHGRVASQDERKRVAIPRRSTKGPLDADFDDPLADHPAAAASPAPTLSPRPISRVSHSPIRSSPLSPSVVSRPTTPVPPPAVEPPEKDFSHLLSPQIYHPLPPQSVPQSFLSAPHQPPPSTPLRSLLDSGHYRLAAIAAAHILTKDTSPNDQLRIFSLLYLRLACLTLLNQHAMAAVEAKALGDLSSTFYKNPITGQHIVPWELRVLAVRLIGLGYGDWRRGVMGYYELGREARQEAIRAAPGSDQKKLWKGRLRELGIRTANALVEMGECEGAARHLSGLVRADVGTEKEDEADKLSAEAARLKSMEALVWLRAGDVDAAKRCVAASPSPAPHTPSTAEAPPPTDPLNALIAMAEADYEAALEVWTALAAQSPTDPMIRQNRAVCLLYVGRILEARETLQNMVEESADSAAAFHALTFNLSTIYELCTERSRERKLELVDKVAALEPGVMGWERSATDFKL
ncbi:uncharacterized protein K452DRAFT_300405 [Aplosporella prunicola CBS 121167]|uniref:Uncharacterized protein n=1 Tax=Aplosporella prunicola CBS 121167 TaxID=1176127 RepID=A0A6A6B5D1_9PEZI|nr:uncharacterized protein K452DRAFT_300405 [Aplosporella prunicola CBS 121167]KAF2139352.1 hypothetical protein K452DRAFT_300405 [Aplosporella prunicola CBS 121167]